MSSYTRTVNFSLPRNPNAPLIFTPLDSVLINDAGEIVTKAARSATTDAEGAGSIVLDTPDDSGRRAWVWQVELPDGETPQFALTWGAGAAPLAALLAADATRLTPNVLASLLASLYSLTNAGDADWVAAGVSAVPDGANLIPDAASDGLWARLWAAGVGSWLAGTDVGAALFAAVDAAAARLAIGAETAGAAAARVATAGGTMTGALIVEAATPTIIGNNDIYTDPALRVLHTASRNAAARYPTLEIHNPNDGSDVATTKYAGSSTLQLRAGATQNLPRYIHFAKWDGGGANNWIWGVNSGNVALMYSSDDLTHRLWMEQASGTGHSSIAAAGPGAIKLNHHPNDATGTGGLDVHMGGAGGTANKRLLRVRKATPGDNTTDTIVNLNVEAGADLLLRFDEAENARWTFKYDTGDNALMIYSDVAAKNVMIFSDAGRCYFGTGGTPSHLVNILDDTDPVIHISTMTPNLALAAAIDLMEAPTAFGTAGAYGFRIKLDGSVNLFSIQSGSTTTVTDRLTIARDTGFVGVNTTAATEQLDINGNGIRIRTARTPASAGAAGNAGTIVWDTSYLYVCTATNTWKRLELLTW